MTPIFNYFKHPASLMDSLVKNCGQWLPDSVYLKLRYRFQMGKRLNLKNPTTFNEKLQWLKLYDRNPEYTRLVDKILVKEYVARVLGPEYVVPLLGAWDRPEDIDWDHLPNRFVLKTNHSGGNTGVVICKDKNSFDRQDAIRRLNASLQEDVYRNLREWPYRDVKKRVFAEQFIDPAPNNTDLHDYKFFCFNGVVRCFKIDFDRQTNHHANYYDRDGSLLPFGELALAPIPEKELSVPSNYVKMIELAEKIAQGKRFVRVDFYNVNGRIFFGEITFYPAGGMGEFTSDGWDETLGTWLKL